jgi:hypothetical protein
MPLAGGNGSNDATRDEDVIRAWWKDAPNANVGVSLDKTGIADIAPDCPEWAATFKANGMPATTLYSSGAGAGHWHSWYRLPKGGPIARINISKQYDIMSQGNAVAPGSIHPSGRPYELRTRLLPVEDLPLAPAWAVEMLQARVRTDRKEHTPEDWASLPSGVVLAHSRRFQALCKANQQLRAVCAGEAVSVAGDSSVSAQRAVFVNQLIRARYPYNEIRALALHFSGVLQSNPKWFETDIDRLIVKYTPQGYSPESTGVIAEATRGGRHYEITAGELLDRYHAAADCGLRGIVLEWTVSEAAERLGVSTGTIKRREVELIEAGQIRREYGRVILSPDTWENRSQRIETRQTTTETTVVDVNSGPDESETVYENTIGSQFDMPQQDAPNTPEIPVCIERAHAEITHSPNRDLDAAIERDSAALAACWAGLSPDQRHEKPPKQARFIGRGQQVKATYQQRKRHGAAPMPAHYRPRVELAIEDLPEPPHRQGERVISSALGQPELFAVEVVHEHAAERSNGGGGIQHGERPGERTHPGRSRAGGAPGSAVPRGTTENEGN